MRRLGHDLAKQPRHYKAVDISKWNAKDKVEYKKTGNATLAPGQSGWMPLRAPLSLDGPRTNDMFLTIGRVGPDECPTNADREALYNQFQPLVGSLLRKYGRTSELRKDLTGEIYYQFCRLVRDYDPARGIPICAYLHNMLKQSVFNYVRDYWRKESRFIQLDQEQGEAYAEKPSEARAVVEDIIAQEIRGALPEAIAALPHRQRLVVVWRYYDGRSFEEIAEQLGVKPATARSLLRHGIAALRKRLAQEAI